MQKRIEIIAALSAAEGFAAFIWLLSFPTNRQTYSLFRFTGLSIILLIALVFTAIFIYLQSRKESVRLIEQLVNFKGRILLSFLLITVSLLLWIAILFKDQWLLYINESTYTRLIPPIAYVLLLCLQAGVFLLTLSPGRNNNTEVKSVWKPAFILWGCFLTLWFLISISHLGLIHDVVGLSWGPPGTPLTFAQVNLGFVISFLLVFGLLVTKTYLSKIPLPLFSVGNIIIFLALWSCAVVLWWNQPIRPTHFTHPPMPPNNEYYPNSDAQGFDKSSYHLLYGVGFANQLTRRPLYVALLAFFHKVAGPDYEDTIFLQILFLAFIPAGVFLLVSDLSNRLSGLLAGGLIIFRETNAIKLSGAIVTSHAKLMMSDMIAMLGIVFFLYVTVKLLFKEDRNNWELGIIGASLGLIALVRAQVLILVLPLLLFSFISKKQLKLGVRTSIFILLGLVLVMSPWIWRNWNLTGTFVLDDRGEEELLARNYSSTPFSLPSPLADETQKEFSARLKRTVFTFIVTHPMDVLFFVSNHFFRNLITSAIYIAPIYSSDSPSVIVERLPFWGEWNGSLTPAGTLSIFINLAIIAFGISLAERKNKYAGWFPFIVFLVYSFGNALVRSSGWRFCLPVDWIILGYYSIGLTYLPSKFETFFKENSPEQAPEEKESKVKRPVFRALILFLLITLGASVPIAERLIRARSYDSLTDNVKAGRSTGEVISSAEIDTFLAQKDAVLLSGIALYPRYVRPNSRISIEGAPKDKSFLYFSLLNQSDYPVLLPLQSSPKDVPHTAVVSVIGCRQDNYVSAFAVIVQEPIKQILIREPNSSLTCPLTAQP